MIYKALLQLAWNICVRQQNFEISLFRIRIWPCWFVAICKQGIHISLKHGSVIWLCVPYKIINMQPFMHDDIHKCCANHFYVFYNSPVIFRYHMRVIYKLYARDTFGTEIGLWWVMYVRSVDLQQFYTQPSEHVTVINHSQYIYIYAQELSTHASNINVLLHFIHTHTQQVDRPITVKHRIINFVLYFILFTNK